MDGPCLRKSTKCWLPRESLTSLFYMQSSHTLVFSSQSQPRVFALDAHIEPLLAFPSSLVLTTLSAYQDGRLIAQDKASCMPAWVLLAPILADLEDAAERGEGGDDDEKEKKGKKNLLKVLDATAAPGNKTTMAAAMLGSEGKVIACERDQGRFKVLKDMCKKADASSECFSLQQHRGVHL